MSLKNNESVAKSVVIIGSGALANLFAARLLAANIPVTMWGTWPEGVAALKKYGVCYEHADGRETAYPVDVITPGKDISGVKLALVLVKSWQTERAAHQLKSALTSEGLALTLQNGFGNREILVESLGAARVVVGVTTTGATLLGPGRVRSGGEGRISLENHPAIDVFVSLFTKAGFTTEIAPDVDALLWSKLLVNAAINPLTALLRIKNGRLLELDAASSLMSSLARETFDLAQALNIALPFDDPVKVVADVAQRTAQNRSSMLQDITRGAPTEIDAICGAIVSAGEKIGFVTPLNRAMWLLVKAAAHH